MLCNGSPKEKAMSHTVPSQQPAVVLRSNYQHLRTLLAIALAVIVGLAVAVAVLATRTNHATLASPITQSATQANPSAETGARLDHSGRNTTATETTNRLANYPDAPPTASPPHPSISYYLYGGCPPFCVGKSDSRSPK
jgi:hypothetical protein